MARERPDGTPRQSRARRYIFPADRHAVLWTSMAAAGVLATLLTVGYFAGARRTLSPGDMSSPHARIDLKCAQCHDGGAGVVSLRCERCHDPGGTDRLVHSSHVLLGSGDARKADRAEPMECVTCHIEHRGRESQVARVDDRECASCHVFATLAGHTEFAAVTAQATAGQGITFSHQRHMIEVRSSRAGTCDVCHEQTPDRLAFQPITFDRHCATCHTAGGLLAPTNQTDPLSPTVVVSPENVPPAWLAGSRAAAEPLGRKIQVSGLKHRDGWALFNLARLRYAIDRDGVQTERQTLRGGIAYLEQLQRLQTRQAVQPAQIDAAIDAVRTELADLDQQVARPATADADAIQEISQVALALARQLQEAGLASASEVAAPMVSPGAAAATPAASDDGDARFQRRRQELLALLARITARTPEGPLQDRAASLKREIEQLNPDDDSDSSDAGPLLARLSDLDDSLRTIRSLPDQGLRAEVDRLDLLRRYAGQRISGGLTPEEFDGRKAELLSLLDTIERRGDATIRFRVSALRQRVVAVRPGSIGDDEVRRTQRQRQKQLDRLLLERELLEAPADREEPPAQDASIDQAELARTLARLRTALGQVEQAPRMAVATTADDRAQLKGELDALLLACQKCHEYDGSGARLAPVRIAEPVMARSTFNHAPHTTQTKCETCHGSVDNSQLSSDVNVPGVATCQSCHGPSKARGECETCHVYHPRSAASLVRFTP